MRFLFKLVGYGALAVATVVGLLLVTDFSETVELAEPADPASISEARGELLLGLAGCINCHTVPKEGAAPLAGGRPLKTPFGVFYSPNITNDPDHGIGGWSRQDFVRALRYGRAPDGGHYFPAFPYVAFTRMTDADMLAIYAALMARAGVAQADRSHDLQFPFNLRWTMRFWKLLHFDSGVFAPDPAKPTDWNRGAYIVEALAHCGECHTPRYPTGGLDRARWLAGAKNGPEGETAPNLTPDDKTGLGVWEDVDIAFLLSNGVKVDGDVVDSVMYEVVEKGTARLQKADLAAIVAYLNSLAPIANPDAPAAQGF